MNPALRKTLLDLAITVGLPVLILSPNLLGSGFSVAAALGGGQSGNIRAYLMSALIPVAYVLWDLLMGRNFSPIALFGGLSAVINGALAFWFVDGLWHALKDSVNAYLLGGLVLVSALTRTPLLKVFLQLLALPSKPAHRAALLAALEHPAMGRAFVVGSAVFGGLQLLLGAGNSVYNFLQVTAPFGTEAFNAQVASVNAVVRLPSLLVGAGGFMAAFFVVERQLKATYGPQASLAQPDSLAGAPSPAA
ncbi:VC0807 family protein [Deinococcus aquaedulcis]|uniref:VC0807 family protein n=1 Tax=Deinococcus aquaedulcis TaxID=2840455 RepID=UPI001C8301F2|nr:VC0807 family protein [Deinococcus aquaedulcis]